MDIIMLDPNYWYSIAEIRYFLESSGYSFHHNSIRYWIKNNNIEYVMPQRKILVNGKSFNDFFYGIHTQNTQIETKGTIV
jgi:hypothetical protein